MRNAIVTLFLIGLLAGGGFAVWQAGLLDPILNPDPNDQEPPNPDVPDPVIDHASPAIEKAREFDRKTNPPAPNPPAPAPIDTLPVEKIAPPVEEFAPALSENVDEVNKDPAKKVDEVDIQQLPSAGVGFAPNP